MQLVLHSYIVIILFSFSCGEDESTEQTSTKLSLGHEIYTLTRVDAKYLLKGTFNNSGFQHLPDPIIKLLKLTPWLLNWVLKSNCFDGSLKLFITYCSFITEKINILCRFLIFMCLMYLLLHEQCCYSSWSHLFTFILKNKQSQIVASILKFAKNLTNAKKFQELSVLLIVFKYN